MKGLLLSSTALVAFATNYGAEAADFIARKAVKAPVAPVATAAPFSWTGFYAGPVGGYSWRDPLITITGTGPAATFLSTGLMPSSVPVDPKGWLGGLQAGYNYQVGMAIFGFEADFSSANIRDGGTAGPGLPLTEIFLCGKICTITNTFRFITTAEQKLDLFGTVRGRLGLTPFERFLVFLSGGLAYGRANLSASVQNLPGTSTVFPPPGAIPTVIPACSRLCATGSTTQWLTGWTYGFGGEYAFTNFLSMKFEYLRYDLGNLSLAFSDPRFAASVFNASAEFRGNIVRLGLSFRLP